MYYICQKFSDKTYKIMIDKYDSSKYKMIDCFSSYEEASFYMYAFLI